MSNLSHVMRIPVFGVSDKVRYKPGCTSTEADKRLELLNLGTIYTRQNN